MVSYIYSYQNIEVLAGCIMRFFIDYGHFILELESNPVKIEPVKGYLYKTKILSWASNPIKRFDLDSWWFWADLRKVLWDWVWER